MSTLIVGGQGDADATELRTVVLPGARERNSWRPANVTKQVVWLETSELTGAFNIRIAVAIPDT